MKIISFSALMILLLFSCKKENNNNNDPKDIINPNLPSIVTDSVSGVSQTSAKVHSTVTSEGGAAVILAGIAWGANPNPTTFDNIVPSTGFGVGSFVSEIKGLEEGTTYYVRSYATNTIGTTYSTQKQFTTLVNPAAVVSTGLIDSVIVYAARVSGTVLKQGTTAVTERGICYSLTPAPTVANSKVIVGSGLGEFSVIIQDLQPDKKYYARAYAINSAGTVYGEEKSFTTMRVPEINFSVSFFNFGQLFTMNLYCSDPNIKYRGYGILSGTTTYPGPLCYGGVGNTYYPFPTGNTLPTQYPSCASPSRMFVVTNVGTFYRN